MDFWSKRETKTGQALTMESKHTCPRIHIAGHRTAKIERNIGYLRRPVAFVPSEHGFRTKQN